VSLDCLACYFFVATYLCTYGLALRVCILTLHALKCVFMSSQKGEFVYRTPVRRSVDVTRVINQSINSEGTRPSKRGRTTPDSKQEGRKKIDTRPSPDKLPTPCVTMDLSKVDLEIAFKCENFTDLSKCFMTMHQSLVKINENVCDLTSRVSAVEKDVEWIDNEVTNIK
jgi:hypothetical protein